MREGLGEGAANFQLMRKGALTHTLSAVLRARQQRKEMSASERVLWGLLRKDQLGFRFRRQVPVGKYWLDFYCPAASLNVEVDGEQHALRVRQDRDRDAFLKSQGIQTIRIPSLDLFDASSPRLEQWIRVIEETCTSRVATPPPNPLLIYNQNEEGE
jgi:very-short-patch-repair endonuclease